MFVPEGNGLDGVRENGYGIVGHAHGHQVARILVPELGDKAHVYDALLVDVRDAPMQQLVVVRVQRIRALPRDPALPALHGRQVQRALRPHGVFPPQPLADVLDLAHGRARRHVDGAALAQDLARHNLVHGILKRVVLAPDALDGERRRADGAVKDLAQ